METRVFTFAKTFSEIEHAESFLRGNVRMQTIKHFQGLEHTDKALRGDAYEGMSGIFQPSQLSEITIAQIKIKASELTGPLRIGHVEAEGWHVFCMHTIGITPADPENFETLDDLKRAVGLDERCARLGEHVVYLLEPDVFAKRIGATIEALGYPCHARLVSYYSDLEFSGFFEAEDVPFKKPRRFSYQKEWRVVAKTPKGIPTPLVLELGDISDIAKLTTTAAFNDGLEVKVDD